jgi:hypothetical protein
MNITTIYNNYNIELFYAINKNQQFIYDYFDKYTSNFRILIKS